MSIEDVDIRQDLLERTVALSAALPAEEVAVVFPGRRAVSHFALALARRRGGPCRPPALLTVEGLARKIGGLPPEAPELLESLRLLRQAVLEAGGPALAPLTADLASFFGPGRILLEVLETLEEEEVSDAALAALRDHPAFEDLGSWARAFHEALPALRPAYRDLCAREGAWTGAQALKRAADQIEAGQGLPWKHIFFSGFFSLTKGQLRLVKALGRSAEVTLLRHHDGRNWEAFRKMESELEPGHPPPAFLPPLPDLTVEAAPSAHAEALRVAQILSEEGARPEETVVVLPDPETLLPLLWDGLGVVEGEFNVTLGYPLARSPLFTLLDAVLRAAEEGEGDSVPRKAYLRLLFHPYVKNYAPDGLEPGSLRIFIHAVEKFLKEKETAKVDLRALEAEEEPKSRARRMNPDGPDEAALSRALAEVHGLFFRRVRAAERLEELAGVLEGLLGRVADRSPAPRHPFYRPSFQAAARCLGTLQEVARRDGGGVASEPRRLCAFVRERLREVRVPFTGLPVRGLQVMGVLETQTLRFPSVVLLDASDDLLPTSPPPDPLLPPAFRKALGLPGVLDRTEIYRYHVFRLLESCRKAWVLYTDPAGKGRSPFVEQLLWEARRAGEERTVVRLALRGGGHTDSLAAVRKSPELVDRLRALAFSPTALDAYLECPLKFYWGTALCLREVEPEEETDSRRLGTHLHALLRDLFEPYVGRELSPGAFEEMAARLPARAHDLLAGMDSGFLLGVLAEKHLGQVLGRERERCPAGTFLMAVEEKMEMDLDGVEGGPVRIAGKVDRLDRLPDGRLRITDYKSGKDLKKDLPKRTLPDLQADRRRLKKGLRSLQLPLYVEMVRRRGGLPPERIEARLLSLREPEEEPPHLDEAVGSVEAFLDGLLLPVVRRLVEEILDPDRPFEAEPADPGDCGTCPYAVPCRRPLASRGVY